MPDGSSVAADAATPSPFHWGEQYVQRKIGVRAEAEALGRHMLRSFMPDQHRRFYEEQVLFYLGTVDTGGRPWASALFGEPGFLTTPDPRHLVIAPVSHALEDPINLALGSKVGALGLQLHTRRRNRVNGTVVGTLDDGSVLLEVDQAFGNCPKYIQTRNISMDPTRLASHREAAKAAKLANHSVEAPISESALGAEQVSLIRSADTFLLATVFDGGLPVQTSAAGADPAAAASVGCDVSHRGGAPGFVDVGEVEGVTELVWPDYVGNNQFNSLGNIHANPACGLLFIDWESGDTLQLTGRARVLFDDRSQPGAQRAVHFRVLAWRHARGAVPLLPAPAVESSPYNPRLLGGDGARTAGPTHVRLARMVHAGAGIKTFEFEAPQAMREALAAGRPPYAAGQFASFDIEVQRPGDAADVNMVLNRTWTISSHPSETASSGLFSITVKKAGLISGWLHEEAAPGVEIAFRGVGGTFTPDASSQRPALLVAGGIGITPMRTMFKDLVHRGIPTTLLYSVRSPEEAAFLQELSSWAADANKSAQAIAVKHTLDQAADLREHDRARFSVVATVTGAAGAEWTGMQGRIDAALLQEVAPGGLGGWQVYLCGPTAFMADLELLLQAAGADAGHVHTESFSF